MNNQELTQALIEVATNRGYTAKINNRLGYRTLWRASKSQRVVEISSRGVDYCVAYGEPRKRLEILDQYLSN